MHDATFNIWSSHTHLHLRGGFFGGPIFDCMPEVEIPYRSNLASDACFSFTASGRQDKKFSPGIYGTITVPRPEQVSEVCKHIRRSPEEYYIPLVVGCILPGERTIDDVLYSPRDYSYPAIFIHCAATCPPSIVQEGIMEKVKTHRHIIKNMAFDLERLNVCI